MIYFIFHIICSVLTYGMVRAHIEAIFRTWDRDDIIFALAIACAGPIGLIASLIQCGFRSGLKFR